MQVGRAAGMAALGIVAAGTVAAIAIARNRDREGGGVVEQPHSSPTPQPPEPGPTTSVASAPTTAEPEQPGPTTPPSTTTPTTQPPAPTPPPATTPPAPTTTEPTPAGPTGSTYIVQPGDTLGAIARRFDTTVARLVELNSIADPNLIRVGQVLRIDGAAPVGEPVDPAPGPPPTSPVGPPAAVPAGPPLRRVPGATGKVALTFDDGPNGATTDAILGALDRLGVRATFFVVGNNAARDGERLARMHRTGHVVANHSWDHPQLTDLTDAQIRTQLADTSDAIERATGRRPDMFRPPYGARSDRVDAVARELGMRDVLWDVDTVDWSRPGADAIVASAVNDARDGSIILMHDGGGDREQTVAAVERVVRGLRERGFDLVTVPQLVQSGA